MTYKTLKKALDKFFNKVKGVRNYTISITNNIDEDEVKVDYSVSANINGRLIFVDLYAFQNEERSPKYFIKAFKKEIKKQGSNSLNKSVTI